MTVFIAALETKHFSFDAAADTARHARAALLKGLMIHGKQLKLSANWYEDLIGDISVREMTLGLAYRDRVAVTTDNDYARRARNASGCQEDI